MSPAPYRQHATSFTIGDGSGTAPSYRGELEGYLRKGALARLDTAFSRDQGHQIHVQHRLREQGAELWRWLQDGAYIYVCGDPQRMAKDVDDGAQ